MRTFIVFVAAIAAVAGAFGLLARFPWAGRPLLWIFGAVERAVAGLCRAACLATAFLLSPSDDDRVAWHRGLLWTGVGLIPLAAFFALAAARIGPDGVLDAGYLLIAGVVYLAFLLGSVAFVVYEDYDVMDGGTPAGTRRFGASHATTRPWVIGLSAALFAAYVIAIGWWLSAVHGVVLVETLPHTGFAAADAILIGLRALPTDLILSLVDRLTGSDTSVVFGASPAAQVYYFAAMVVGWGLLGSLVAVAIQQSWQSRRIVAEIGDNDERHALLIERARLAPPIVRRAILRAATTPGDVGRQERLIVAAQEAGLFALPEIFSRALGSFPVEVQSFGLDRCAVMFRYQAKAFEPEHCAAILCAAAPVLRSGDLELEPLKKLLRLVTSIIIVKKEAVEVSEAVKATIMAALKEELAKPQAREDAALRGFLRDLQSALGGAPIIVKPIPLPDRDIGDWLKRLPVPPAAADRAARHDSPSPTVH